MKRTSSGRAVASADGVQDGISIPEVGVVSIDDAHSALAALVCAIVALAKGDDPEHVGGLLLRLVEETSDHFASEHELMRATRFPEREAHVEEHGRLLQQLTELLAAHSAGQMSSLGLESLRDWLSTHIQGMDRSLGDYLVAYTRDQTTAFAEPESALGAQEPMESPSDLVLS